MKSKQAPGRTMPHSIDAEQRLLSCCMLDGADVIARCLEARISDRTFYVAANGLIFATLVDLYNRKQPTEIWAVAEELKEAKKLDLIGGVAFLTEISAAAPMTTDASYLIEKVASFAVRRELIKRATEVCERAYQFDGDGIEQFLADQEITIREVTSRESSGVHVRQFGTFELPPENDPANLLGKNRFLVRGDALVISSSAGMGKSSISLQWSTLAALGRPFLGIASARPLKSIIFQAEDSDGDVAEVQESVFYALELSEADRKQVMRNVRIVRVRAHRGQRFLQLMRREAEKFDADLVWLNPLQSFTDGDIKDSADIGKFLREGLNGANINERWAYMVVHHTTKPVATKDRKERDWNEVMYDMAGGAEIINWARAIISLRPTPVQGKFNLVLAKRGTRAGVCDEEGNTLTTIPIQHSDRTATINGKVIKLIFWETRDADADAPSGGGRSVPGKNAKYSDSEIVSYFPASDEEALGYGQIARDAKAGCGIGNSAFATIRERLMANGHLTQNNEKLYRRTESGDELAQDFLRSRP